MAKITLQKLERHLLAAADILRGKMDASEFIEPVLGHMKSDGLLERNHLHGPEGDAINAILCAIGQNCRLLLAWFRRLLARLLLSASHFAASILRAIAAIIQQQPAPQTSPG